MKHRKKTLPGQFEMQAILNDLEDHSDLEAALVGHSLIERVLHARLEKLLRDDLEKDKVNQIFQHGGPFESYSAKSRIIYAFGLCSRIVYDDLATIGHIRNIFGHAVERMTFDDPAIAVECDKLKMPLTDTPEFIMEFPRSFRMPAADFRDNSAFTIVDAQRRVLAHVPMPSSHPIVTSRDAYLWSVRIIWAKLSIPLLQTTPVKLPSSPDKLGD